MSVKHEELVVLREFLIELNRTDDPRRAVELQKMLLEIVEAMIDEQFTG